MLRQIWSIVHHGLTGVATTRVGWAPLHLSVWENVTSGGRSGRRVGRQGVRISLRVPGGGGIHLRSSEYRMGLDEGSSVPRSPCRRGQGISAYVGAAHDGGAAGAFESGVNARPLHYALLSRRRVGKQVSGRYGG